MTSFGTAELITIVLNVLLLLALPAILIASIFLILRRIGRLEDRVKKLEDSSDHASHQKKGK